MTVQVSLRWAVCVLFLVPLAASAATGAENETKTVKLGKLELTVPNSWKQEEPASNLRLGQFRIPAVEGEKEDAELAVFSFGPSDLADNVRRWIGQFQAEGRTVKVTKGEAGDSKYLFVEISGTYNKPVGPPIQGKTEPSPNSRVFAIALQTADKQVYFLKMAGKDKTVAAQGDAFRTSFGADAKKEEEVKFDE